MPIDLSAIKARLQSLDKKDSKSQKTKAFIWKPEKDKGKFIIRIVPSQHQPENPFFELKFHYGLNNKTFLSPSTFNRPDPVLELSEHLKKSGDKDQWRLGRSLEPKLRTYVPIIVRGEEEKGVRFWGFGQTVYKALLGIMADPDYGDVSDLNSGFDFTVECKEVAGKQYPDTSILPKPRPCPVIDPKHPKAKELMELITQKQANILEVYEVASYEDLKNNLEQYLAKKDGDSNPSDNEPQVVEPTVVTTAEQVAAFDPLLEPEVVVAVEVTPPIGDPAVAAKAVTKVTYTPAPTSPMSPSAAAAGVKTSVNDFTKVFDNLFNS